MLSFKGWGVMTVTVKKPVTIRRISDLRDNHMTLGLFCLECNRWGEIIPNEWLSSGKKDLDYVNQKFKCGDCRGRQKDLSMKCVHSISWLYSQDNQFEY